MAHEGKGIYQVIKKEVTKKEVRLKVTDKGDHISVEVSKEDAKKLRDAGIFLKVE